jgi:probable HAF family extracellular repeat protein
MNSQTWTRIITLALFAALVIPIQLAAENKAKQNHPHQYHHYQLIDLGTFGGPQSYVYDDGYAALLNNHGELAGWADTSTPDPFPNFCFNSGCFVSHAFQWRNGVRADLGVLPHGWSSGATWISPSGLIAGFSQNGEIDPLFAGFPEMQSVLWKQGKIIDLGTLPEGGYESVAISVNSGGQVVGAALNMVPDPNSMIISFNFFPPIPYQTRAFLWESGKGMQDLGTLPGGTDAQATLINDRSQVVGWSYTSPDPSPSCSVFGISLTTGSFLWEKGKGMVDLGGFGGTCTLAYALNNRGQIIGESWLEGDLAAHPFIWNRATGLSDLGTLGGSFGQPQAINDNGQVVGGASKPGDVQFDAFLWDGKMHDLGALGSDTCAWAFSINAAGQVVGHSCTDNPRGFVWEDGGPMVDLNTLVPSQSALYVQSAWYINDTGEIAGAGVDAGGNSHALLLTPCDETHPGIEGCDYSMVDGLASSLSPTPHDVLSGTDRLPPRRTGRYHIPGPQPQSR